MKRCKWLTFLSCGMLILLMSCSQGQQTSIKLREVTRSLFYAPQYVALEKDFFADEGLDVELQTTWGGDRTWTASLSDGLDIALVGSETPIYVHAQASKASAATLAPLTQADGTCRVSRERRPDFEWAEVKESTFLGQRKGGMPQMVGEYVLKKHGIDPHHDLN